MVEMGKFWPYDPSAGPAWRGRPEERPAMPQPVKPLGRGVTVQDLPVLAPGEGPPAEEDGPAERAGYAPGAAVPGPATRGGAADLAARLDELEARLGRRLEAMVVTLAQALAEVITSELRRRG